MSKYSKEDIICLVEEEDVELIRLQFIDIFGMLRNMATTFSQLEEALDNRRISGGSAIEGFARAEEADTYLYPNLDTFEIFPQRPQQGRVARLICDTYCSDSAPLEEDPRYVLKKVLKKVEDMGYRFNVGPECRFFLFHTSEGGGPTTATHGMAGYFDVGPIDLVENVRQDVVLNLEEMGFEIKSSHHEIAPAQREMDFKHAEDLVTADDILILKMAVETIAKRHGFRATFMPKPEMGVNGSRMHINTSLEDKSEKSIFADTSDELGLSEMAYQSMASIPAHIRGMTILTNPIVNSYKQLIPGYDTSTYIGRSSAAKREQLIQTLSSRGESTRIKLCFLDSAVNPYLALAVCLVTGLDGIKKNMVLPKALSANVLSMDKRKQKELDISQLPKTLGEAIEAFEGDELLMGVLGNHIYTKYLETKKEEWGKFHAQVTDWEIGEYLYKFQAS